MRRPRRASGWAPTPIGPSPRPATASPAATRCCCAELLTRARGRGCAARRRRTPASSSTSARARSRAPCCCAWRASRPTPIAVARAVAMLGRGRRRSPPSGPSRASPRPSVRGGHRRRSPAPSILRPESPLGFVHPLVRDAVYRELPPGERELAACARRDGCCATPGADADAVGRAAPARAARGEPWVVDVLRDAGRRRAAPRRAGERRRLPAARARGAAAAELRPDLLLELGLAEALVSGPGRRGAPAEAVRVARGPPARGRSPQRRWPACCSSLGRAGRRPSRSRRRRCRRAARRPRDDARAARGRASYRAIAVGASRAGRARGRLRPLRERDRRRAARCAGRAPAGRPWRPTTGPHGGRPGRARASALALRALGDGDADRGRQRPASTIAPLAHPGDRRPRGGARALGARARRRPPPRLAVLSISAVHLWRGCTLLRRGELAGRRGDACARPYDEFARCGATPGLADALLGGVPGAHAASSGATSPGARCARARARDRADDSDGASLPRHAEVELLLARGRAAPRPSTRRAPPLALVRRCVNPAVARGGALRGRGARRARPAGGGPRRSREAERRARRGRSVCRGPSARALRVLGGSRRATTGSPTLRGGGRASSTGSPARLEHAKALAALGRALRLRAAADRGPRAAAPRAGARRRPAGRRRLVEHARAELFATGARPRTTALAGRRRADRQRAPGGRARRRRGERTATSPRRSSSPRRRSRCTSRTPTASSASARAGSSPQPSPEAGRWPGRAGPVGRLRSTMDEARRDSCSRSVRATRRGPSSSGSSTPGRSTAPSTPTPTAPGEPYAITIPPPNVTGSAAHGPRAQRDDPGPAHPPAPHARPQRPVAARHGPRRHRHPERRRAPAARAGHDEAGLGREAFVQRVWEWRRETGSDDHRAVQAPRRLAGLPARAVHDGRRATRGRCSRSSCGCTRRATSTATTTS